MPINISVAAGTSEATVPARGTADAGQLAAADAPAADAVADPFADPGPPDDDGDPRSHPTAARKITSKKFQSDAAGR
jgi:hypothetical protein